MNGQNDQLGGDGLTAGVHGGVRPNVAFDTGSLPVEMRGASNWICWKPVRKSPTGAWTKVPISPVTGNAASVTDPSGWSSLERAAAFAREQGLGLGFVFTEQMGLVGIDLDECLDERGGLTAEAAELVQRFGSYAELTPGGRGVHVIIRAKKPTARCTASSVCGAKKVEIYGDGRYFTMTGRVITGNTLEITQGQAELDAWCAELWSEDRAERDASPARGEAGTSDEEVLAMARKGRGGMRFSAMFDRGDLSRVQGDDSRGDLAVCRRLAQFTGDAAQIDRLFRASKLMRGKWDERRGDRTYGQRTIDTALQGATTPAERVDLPEVVLGTDEYRVVDEVLGHLAAEPDLFQRGGVLVRATRSGGDAARVIELDEPGLRGRITRRIRLVSVRNGEETDSHPPAWLTAQIRSHGEWPGVRELNGVRDHPVLRPDGSVFCGIGYDPVTKILRVGQAGEAEGAGDPDRASAELGLALLKDLLQDFPFASDRDRSAAIAMLITVVARSAYEGSTPLFLIEANVRGSGKTLLASVAGRLARKDGVAMSSMTQDEEFRKFVTSAALRGESVLILDNLSGSIGGPTLDRVLTARRWSDRLLGSSTTVDVPMSIVWIATGNNPALQADVVRRVIPIRLCSMIEHPERRDGFAYPDLLKYVESHRQRLIAACQVIPRAYLTQCERVKIRPMGSFEDWSDLVRGALVWMGEPDPLPEPGEMEAASDAQAEALKMLLEAIAHEKKFARGFCAADLLTLDSSTSKAFLTIRDALIELQMGDEDLTPARIGRILKSSRNRVVGGWRLVSHAKTMHGVRWAVESVEDGSGLTAKSGLHDDDDGDDADLEPLPMRALEPPQGGKVGVGSRIELADPRADGTG